MILRELNEGVADVIIHQCLEETPASQIHVPGLCDWDPWAAASKLAFLESSNAKAKFIALRIRGNGHQAAIELGPGRSKHDALR
jgi:hypothetical protein